MLSSCCQAPRDWGFGQTCGMSSSFVARRVVRGSYGLGGAYKCFRGVQAKKEHRLVQQTCARPGAPERALGTWQRHGLVKADENQSVDASRELNSPTGPSAMQCVQLTRLLSVRFGRGSINKASLMRSKEDQQTGNAPPK